MLFVGIGFSQLMWQRNYGGPDLEEGFCVQQTTDGGYIIAGMSASFGNLYQVYLIKTDSMGDTAWSRTYGGASYEYGYSVHQTTDGGYIIVGFTDSFGNGRQVYLIKTDSFGDTLWTKTYGDTLTEYGYAVQQTTDGGYIIVGLTNSFGNGNQVYLIKTDSLGDTLWTKTYGGPGRDRGFSVQQTADGGYIIAGDFNYPLNYDPVALLKTDSLGDTLWTKTYGTEWYFGRSVQQTLDGGYVIAGYNNSGGAYLVKTDSLGDTLWTKVIYWEGGAIESYCVRQTLDGGYVMAGKGLAPYEYYYFILIKTDSLGDTLWIKTYGTGMTFFGARCVQQTTDGGYILVGTNDALGNGSQIWLIKTDSLGNVGIAEERQIRRLLSTSQPIVSPNPFVSFTKIIGYEKERFILYDVSGRQVGSYYGDKIGFGLTAGVYFIVPEDKSFKPMRVVKVK